MYPLCDEWDSYTPIHWIYLNQRLTYHERQAVWVLVLVLGRACGPGWCGHCGRGSYASVDCVHLVQRFPSFFSQGRLTVWVKCWSVLCSVVTWDRWGKSWNLTLLHLLSLGNPLTWSPLTRMIEMDISRGAQRESHILLPHSRIFWRLTEPRASCP